MIALRFLLTPLAVLRTEKCEGRILIRARHVFIFGIRIAYWTEGA